MVNTGIFVQKSRDFEKMPEAYGGSDHRWRTHFRLLVNRKLQRPATPRVFRDICLCSRLHRPPVERSSLSPHWSITPTAVRSEKTRNRNGGALQPHPFAFMPNDEPSRVCRTGFFSVGLSDGKKRFYLASWLDPTGRSSLAALRRLPKYPASMPAGID